MKSAVLVVGFSIFAIGAVAETVPLPSSVPSASLDVKFDVQKFSLANGLTVLMHRDTSSPLVSFHQWYRVGSRHEKPGRTGLAHFFEHLMFKGTTRFPQGQFDKIVQSNGGSNNAFTSRDYTGYFINLPSDKLELAIDIESDRMVNLLFDPKSIASEREVVKEERRMRVDNDVMGTLWEQLFLTVYKVHPYKEPVIGSMKDLEATTLEDLKDFYRTYYAPNNAVVVVSGDIDYADTRRRIERYYGSLSRQSLPDEALPPEPPQMSERSQSLQRDVQAGTLAVVYRTPSVRHPDSAALEVLASILGSGPSSRLHRRIVYQQQAAASISAWTHGQRDSSLFAVTASMKPGQSVEGAFQSTAVEVARLRSTLVSDAEIAKAQSQIQMAFVDQLKTAAGKAYALAMHEALFGDYQVLFEDLRRYEQVTKEDVRRVAQTYLVPTNRSTIRILPKTSTGGASL